MTRYFAQNTPRAGLEHMMMSVPGFQKRGGGMMILSRFCYKPEDVDCRYCLHYRRRSCQVRTCPYIAERLKSGAIEYLDLILEYFGHIPEHTQYDTQSLAKFAFSMFWRAMRFAEEQLVPILLDY